MQPNSTSLLSATPVLVTGATGNHGGTGAFVARSLRKQGVPVRALTRQASERTVALEADGIDVVIGDLHDPRSLARVLDGVEVAYFCYPVAKGIVDAAVSFSSAGRAAGLARIVVMSMGASHPESPSVLGRAQWLAEQVFEWAGFACIHLRIAAFFFENLPLLHSADIEGDGVLRNSYSDAPTSWMAAEDAARISVAALLQPERFEGGALYPTGLPMSHAAIARILSAHLGRPLRHETVSPEAWRARLEAIATHDQRINTEMAAHIAILGASVRQPSAPNDLFMRLTGETPLSLEQLLARGDLFRKSLDSLAAPIKRPTTRYTAGAPLARPTQRGLFSQQATAKGPLRLRHPVRKTGTRCTAGAPLARPTQRGLFSQQKARVSRAFLLRICSRSPTRSQRSRRDAFSPLAPSRKMRTLANPAGCGAAPGRSP